MNRHPRIVTAAAREKVGLARALVPGRLLDHLGGLPGCWEGDATFGGIRPEQQVTHSYNGQEVTTRKADCALYHHEKRHLPGLVTLPFNKPTEHPWAPGWPDVGTVLHELGHFVYDRLLRPYRRQRIYWDRPAAEVRVERASGLMPPFTRFTEYEPTNPGEQFAEAFRIWLSPRWALHADWEPERFYDTDRGPGRISPWGYRWSGRGLLAFFNELAGLPFDLAPVALR